MNNGSSTNIKGNDGNDLDERKRGTVSGSIQERKGGGAYSLHGIGTDSVLRGSSGSPDPGDDEPSEETIQRWREDVKEERLAIFGPEEKIAREADPQKRYQKKAEAEEAITIFQEGRLDADRDVRKD